MISFFERIWKQFWIGAIALIWGVSMCGGPARAEFVTVLVTDEDRFRAHLDAARGAQEELNVSFAFIHDDPVTRRFLYELIRASQRIKVRLLLDGFGNHLSRDTIGYLVQNGVEVRFYNPIRVGRQISSFWRRMHDKMVVADGKVLVTGTENMGEPYYKSLAKPPLEKGYIGRNIRVVGDVAARAQEYFHQVWNGGQVKTPLLGLKLKPEAWNAQLNLFRKAYFEHFSEPPSAASAGFEVESGRIHFVNSLDDSDENLGLTDRVVQMIKSAKKRIIIETPYLNPGDKITDLLMARRLNDDVAVTILTNSAQSDNHPFVNILYRDESRRLLSFGIEVKEWDGKPTIHGKTILVDDRQVLITTRNLNRRSELLDSEIGVYVDDPRVAKLVEKDLKMDHFTPSGAAVRTQNCVQRAFRRILNLYRDQF